MTGKDRKFDNASPGRKHGVLDILRWKLGLGAPHSAHAESAEPVIGDDELWPAETVAPDLARIHSPDAHAMQITWIGHASFLLQCAGVNALIDPVFSRYCAPVPLPGLARRHPPGIAIAELPAIDLVLITHNHYDHLDAKTIHSYGEKVTYLAPNGLRSWFLGRGLSRVEEMDWWDSRPFGDAWTVHCCPAQHFSARTPFDRDRSHWCGWLIETANHLSLYCAGDTGYCGVFHDIRERFGVVDAAILPIGAYSPRWVMKTVHMNPEEAVQAHAELGARLSIAAHWGTFRLTDEPLGEPPARLKRVMEARGLPGDTFLIPKIGETVVVTSPSGA